MVKKCDGVILDWPILVIGHVVTFNWSSLYNVWYFMFTNEVANNLHIILNARGMGILEQGFKYWDILFKKTMVVLSPCKALGVYFTKNIHVPNSTPWGPYSRKSCHHKLYPMVKTWKKEPITPRLKSFTRIAFST